MITGKPKIALLATLAAVLVCLWAYLAGGIFWWLSGIPSTLYQYWYHYGAAPHVQNWLLIASGVALAAIAVPLAALYSPARRRLPNVEAQFRWRSIPQSLNKGSQAG